MDHAKTKEFVLKTLVPFWSPEQIAGHIVATKPKVGRPLSRQTIYRWIQQDVDGTLEKHSCDVVVSIVPRTTKETNYRKWSRLVGALKRANQRTRLGDWEGDTVVSPHKLGGILTRTDRKSGYLRMRRPRDLAVRNDSMGREDHRQVSFGE